MAWKAYKADEEVSKMVMSVLSSDYETWKARHPKAAAGTFEEYVELKDLRPLSQWSFTESTSKKLKGARLVVVHGAAEGTSFLFVYEPSGSLHGKLVGSYSEHHGQDRGPMRHERVTKHLGERGEALL